MSDKAVPVPRPLLITIVCSLLFAGGVFNIIYTFTGVYAPLGVYYSAVNTIIIVIMFAALSGVWEMEKWGVNLFIILLIVKASVDLYSGAFSWWEYGLLIPLIIFLIYRKQMN